MQLDYYNPLVDLDGYVHSLDMVYIEWYSNCTINTVLDDIRELRLKYKSIRYDEYLDRPRHSKYDFYLNGVVFGGVFVSLGKYTNYDKASKTFDIFDMFELRFNPNKYMKEEWFIELSAILIKHGKSGYLRKYDYAIDVPLSPDKVKVFFSRKEYGFYKGTRYYGQSGRHGYLKIYDKQAEMKRKGIEIDPLTRCEYTFFSGKIPSYENIYVLSDTVLKNDLNILKDTDLAIIEMYMQLKALGVEYDLRLGRKKMEKLSPYLFGGYKLLEYGNYLDELLLHIKAKFNVVDYSDDMFLPLSIGEELPFE